MKFTKKCDSTQQTKQSIKNKLDRRSSSAGMFYTSSAGAVTSLILMALLNLTGLTGASVYADSISLSVSTDNLTINMIPMSSTGEFAKSGNMNIAVSTDSSSGYNLSIASSTGSTDLKNGQNTISSIGSAIDENTFSTSSTYNNQWGYKPSHLYNSSTEQIVTNSNFRPLPGSSGEIIAKTKCANGTSPCTSATDNYTLSIGARTTNSTAIGSYTSDTFVITAVTNKSVVSCDSTKLCVQYNGNGLTFPETDAQLPRSVNNVNYNSTTTSSTITKYSHTSNINDAGVRNGNYDANLATKDVVTIDGATSLHLKITYGTENNWDMLYVFAGEYTGTISRNMDQASTGWLYKYMGGNDTTTTVDIDVATSTGTVTLGFYSDGNTQYYGYYAVITGTGTVLERTLSSGEYATPTGTNSIFHGWSTTQTTAGGGLPSDVEYADESEVKTKMPGDEGEAKTLYAVWQQGQTITFTMDSNVSSIAVLNSDGTTAGTITASGQSLTLAQGNTYTIKPTHATGYSTNAITKTTGAGTLSGKSFTVGAGSATLNVTSKPLSPIQNFNCSTLATGDTEEVYDKRDNKTYMIGKLADSKCWMLDNLALNPVTLTYDQLYGTGSDAGKMTNASNTTLGYLKNGGGSSPYTNVAVSSSWSTNYYDRPLINADSIDVVPSGAPSGGEGSNKVGVYYNYCAASAGSYCYAGGAGTGNASYDLCPAGWRMPTGGSSGEYKALYDQYSSASEGQAVAFKNALSTPLSGVFGNGSARDQGSLGYFWSSTYSGSYSMYILSVNASGVIPSDSSSRGNGYSMRCIRSS